ncbi:MAG: high-potential iron-sulfur protein [Sphingobacteriaceae bacterium]
MEDNKYSRREFINKYLQGSTFLLGGALIFGLSSMTVAKGKLKSAATEAEVQPDNINQTKQPTPKKAPAKNPCDDLTGVSADELAKRKKLAYVNQSPIPDSQCGNCALYMPPAKGKSCGGCMLFKGPVRSEGYCAYWAPINN